MFTRDIYFWCVFYFLPRVGRGTASPNVRNSIAFFSVVTHVLTTCVLCSTTFVFVFLKQQTTLVVTGLGFLQKIVMVKKKSRVVREDLIDTVCSLTRRRLRKI